MLTVRCTADDLARQATVTADSYLQSAMKAAREYEISEAHMVTFIGEYMRACAADFAAATTVAAIQGIGDAIREGLLEAIGQLNNGAITVRLISSA